MAYLKPPGIEGPPDNPLEEFFLETYSRLMQTGLPEVTADQDYFLWLAMKHPENVHNDRKERFERLANRYGLNFERKETGTAYIYKFVFTLLDTLYPVRFVGGPLDGEVQRWKWSEIKRQHFVPVLPPMRMSFQSFVDYVPRGVEYFNAAYEIQRRGPEDFRYVLVNDDEWAKWKAANMPTPELERKVLTDWLNKLHDLGVQPVLDLKSGEFDIYLNKDRCEFSIPKKREKPDLCVIEVRRLKQ